MQRPAEKVLCSSFDSDCRLFRLAEKPHSEECKSAVDDEERESQVEAEIVARQKIENKAYKRSRDRNPRSRSVPHLHLRQYAEEEQAEKRTVGVRCELIDQIDNGVIAEQ